METSSGRYRGREELSKDSERKTEERGGKGSDGLTKEFSICSLPKIWLCATFSLLDHKPLRTEPSR